MMEVIDAMRKDLRGSLGGMPALVKDPAPAEFVALLERRRRLGQDLFDEVWEGVLHVNPAPHSRHGKVDGQLARLLYGPGGEAGLVESGPMNLGEPADFRVPDRALLRPGPNAVYLPSAALVVEIVSPGDDTWRKLGFYAAHHVDELLIVDPEKREVDWLALTPTGDYARVERSGLIGIGPAALAEQLDWPD